MPIKPISKVYFSSGCKITHFCIINEGFTLLFFDDEFFDMGAVCSELQEIDAPAEERRIDEGLVLAFTRHEMLAEAVEQPVLKGSSCEDGESTVARVGVDVGQETVFSQRCVVDATHNGGPTTRSGVIVGSEAESQSALDVGGCYGAGAVASVVAPNESGICVAAIIDIKVVIT